MTKLRLNFNKSAVLTNSLIALLPVSELISNFYSALAIMR
jgi:hypothetical protein